MAVGYTRQSSGLIISGATILASHFNDEYNAIESAMHATTGHNHDGTGGGGAPIVLTSGVSGTLPVANGGTGGTTTATARTGLEVPFRGSTSIVAGTTTLTTADNGLIFVSDTTSGNITLSLPLAATAGAGFFFGFTKPVLVNQVIVDPSGAEVISGNATYTGDGIDEAAVIFCDGTKWYVMGAEHPTTVFSKTLLLQTAAANWRTELGVNIGSDVQAYDAGLLSIAGLVTSADKMIYATASDTYATADLSVFARTYLADATQAATQTTLGLLPGTDVQAYDASLLSLAALATAADKLPYATGIDTYAETGLTAFARTILDDATAGDVQTTLGVPPNARDIIAGVGLSGGGDLSADRTLTLDLSELSTATAATGDYAAIEDVTDNSTKKVTLQSIADMATGVSDIKITTFTANGTWTRDANCLAVEVIVVGGGGGGGRGVSTSNSAAGGGGGGGTAIEGFTPAAAGASQSVTVGAGGAGSTSTADGTAGGTSSFGSLCSATGGAGGREGDHATEEGVAGGAGSGGDVNLTGGTGGGCSNAFDGKRGGAGGGTFLFPGVSGSGPDGTGAALDAPANSGGGGAGSSGGSGSPDGGDGAYGIVIVKEWV